MVVPVPVLNVPVIAKSLRNANAVPGTVSSELLSTVPPSVNVPPVESMRELLSRVSAPCRFKSAPWVCKVPALRVSGSTSFRSEVVLPSESVLPLCSRALKVFSPLNVRVTSSSKCRTEVLFEVSVPLPAERLSLNFSVVPLTSKVALFIVPP